MMAKVGNRTFFLYRYLWLTGNQHTDMTSPDLPTLSLHHWPPSRVLQVLHRPHTEAECCIKLLQAGFMVDG